MSKKTIAIFGATGRQGTSIINHILNTRSLSSQYTIRALTRSPTSPAAQSLSSQGIDIVTADIDDPSTLPPALHGAHTVIAITTTKYASDTYAHELTNGRAMADAALASGASYLIFSTLPSAQTISGGKYPVDGFDAKAAIEAYIRSLPIQSAFYAPALFMENLTGALKPRQEAEGGRYVLTNRNNPDTRMPLLATKRDLGKFVGRILEDPQAYVGKTLNAAAINVTWAEIARAMGNVTEKQVKYRQVSAEAFAGSFANEYHARNYGNMFGMVGEFGYYGEKKEEGKEIQELKGLEGEVVNFETFLREEGFTLA